MKKLLFVLFLFGCNDTEEIKLLNLDESARVLTDPCDGRYRWQTHYYSQTNYGFQNKIWNFYVHTRPITNSDGSAIVPPLDGTSLLGNPTFVYRVWNYGTTRIYYTINSGSATFVEPGTYSDFQRTPAWGGGGGGCPMTADPFQITIVRAQCNQPVGGTYHFYWTFQLQTILNFNNQVLASPQSTAEPGFVAGSSVVTTQCK